MFENKNWPNFGMNHLNNNIYNDNIILNNNSLYQMTNYMNSMNLNNKNNNLNQIEDNKIIWVTFRSGDKIINLQVYTDQTIDELIKNIELNQMIMIILKNL